MAYLSEAEVEQVVLDQLRSLGYAVSSDAEIGPDGKEPEREAYADVVLGNRLSAAIERLNPSIPAEARFLIYGVILVVLMRFRPQGLLPPMRRGQPIDEEGRMRRLLRKSRLFSLGVHDDRGESSS